MRTLFYDHPDHYVQRALEARAQGDCMVTEEARTCMYEIADTYEPLARVHCAVHEPKVLVDKSSRLSADARVA